MKTRKGFILFYSLIVFLIASLFIFAATSSFIRDYSLNKNFTIKRQLDYDVETIKNILLTEEPYSNKIRSLVGYKLWTNTSYHTMKIKMDEVERLGISSPNVSVNLVDGDILELNLALKSRGMERKETFRYTTISKIFSQDPTYINLRDNEEYRLDDLSLNLDMKDRDDKAFTKENLRTYSLLDPVGLVNLGSVLELRQGSIGDKLKKDLVFLKLIGPGDFYIESDSHLSLEGIIIIKGDLILNSSLNIKGILFMEGRVVPNGNRITVEGLLIDRGIINPEVIDLKYSKKYSRKYGMFIPGYIDISKIN